MEEDVKNYGNNDDEDNTSTNTMHQKITQF